MTGFIMATTGFLKVNPNPTRAQMAHGISGNLCRCADDNKILDCMLNAADLARRA
jgi:carbon-monoxide dehydrogenase small subunit/xanthine dehydrogenase YagT iron-sulfur-binding subunit